MSPVKLRQQFNIQTWVHLSVVLSVLSLLVRAESEFSGVS